MKNLVAGFVVLGFWIPFAHGQDDWILGGVAEDSFITISNVRGEDVPILGLDIRSSNGGLKANGSGPFTITLLNTPNNVVVGNLGNPFLLAPNAVVKTEIAFDGDPAWLTGTWGNGVMPARLPFSDALSPVAVSVVRDTGNDYRFRLFGHGQELRTFQLDSVSGALIPATAAAPFNSITENSPNRVSFAADGFVRLDGTLTTSAGFSFLGQRDVTFRYHQNGVAEELGPFTVNNYPALPAIDISLNDDLNFVVAGVGQTLSFLNLSSRSGSLVPNDNPAPFTSFGQNTESNILYRGGPVTIVGEVTLAAKWNRIGGIRDVEFFHDIAQNNDRSEFGRVSGYPPRAPTTPIQVEIDNKTHRFVLTGSGNELREFELASPGKSLIPATSTGPFTTVTENTPSKIAYQSAEFVTLDGSLVLSTAYNARVGTPVFYRYLQVGDPATPSRRILDYPAFSDIRVSLDPDSHIVLQGQGERLLGIEITSESGSLIPGASSEPFELTLVNTPQNVTYGVLGEAAAVVLDGSVTLSAAYDPQGQPDVLYTFGLGGNNLVGPISLFQQPPQELAVGVELSANDRWILKGDGQQLEQFNLFSPSGGLLPSDAPAPFTELTQNDATSVRFATNEQVTVDGELTTGAGWNRFHSEPDVTYSFRLKVSEVVLGPLAVPSEVYPEVSLVGIDLSDDNRWILRGNGQKLEQFDLMSESGGLVATDTAAPFAEVMDNDANAIRFVTDSNVTIDGELTVGAGWNRNLGFRDVRYSYREQGFDVTAGPYDVPNSVYPPEPPSNRVLVSVVATCITPFPCTSNDYKFVLIGNGHELRSFEFTSPSGTLIPAQSAEPFASLTENSTTKVSLASDSFVTLDGTLTTDVAYNMEVLGEDVSYRYEQVGFPDPLGPFDVSRGQYPQNQQRDWIEGRIEDGFITLTNFHSDDIPMLGLDVVSTNGGLKANGPGPFTILLLDTPNNVVVGNLGNPFILAEGANVKTDIAFDGDPATLTASWGNGVTPSVISFQHGPVVPEPTSGFLACFAALGLLGCRHRRSNKVSCPKTRTNADIG